MTIFSITIRLWARVFYERIVNEAQVEPLRDCSAISTILGVFKLKIKKTCRF